MERCGHKPRNTKSPRSWKKPGRIVSSSLWSTYSHVSTLIACSWPPELGKKTFPLFRAAQVLVICYHSPRKLKQKLKSTVLEDQFNSLQFTPRGTNIHPQHFTLSNNKHPRLRRVVCQELMHFFFRFRQCNFPPKNYKSGFLLERKMLRVRDF